MKYMLLICRDEPAWEAMSLPERQQIYADTFKLSEELAARGQYLGGNPLHPSSAATSVRVRDGKRLVTDGPFAETREQLGGYMIIDVKNLDEAIAIAGRIPLARTSTIEIRPVREGQPT
ncbi:MAG TPA: YciI family protein [Methylomirabilota bacterium]|nr:YciI family protein [Methylomirabilota bacterium]